MRPSSAETSLAAPSEDLSGYMGGAAAGSTQVSASAPPLPPAATKPASEIAVTQAVETRPTATAGSTSNKTASNLKSEAAAKEAGVAYFIQLSSIAVYGQDTSLITPASVERPTSDYGESKLQGDRLLRSYNETSFKVAIIRVPMIYGENAPGNPEKLSRFIRRFRFVPFRAIANRRTFVSINNLIVIFLRCLEVRRSGTFLVADDESISTLEFAYYLAERSKVKLIVGSALWLRISSKVLAPRLYNSLFGDQIIDNSLCKQILGIEHRLPFG